MRFILCAWCVWALCTAEVSPGSVKKVPHRSANPLEERNCCV